MDDIQHSIHAELLTPYISIIYIYINAQKEIYNVKKNIEQLTGSCLTKERIMYLIKQNQYNLEDKHRLIDLLKFNIPLAYDDIKDFIINDSSRTAIVGKNYLVSLKIVDDIHFADTILHDQNSVIFVFTNTPNTNHNTNPNTNTTTRRVHLKSKNTLSKKRHA